MAVGFLCTTDFFEKHVKPPLGLSIVAETGSTYILSDISTDLSVFTPFLGGNRRQQNSVSTASNLRNVTSILKQRKM